MTTVVLVVILIGIYNKVSSGINYLFHKIQTCVHKAKHWTASLWIKDKMPNCVGICFTLSKFLTTITMLDLYYILNHSCSIGSITTSPLLLGRKPNEWKVKSQLVLCDVSTFSTVQQHLPKNCQTKTSQPPHTCESCVTVTWHTGLRLATGLVRACDDSSDTIRHTQIQHILAISRQPNTSHRAVLCCATHLSDEATD